MEHSSAHRGCRGEALLGCASALHVSPVCIVYSGMQKRKGFSLIELLIVMAVIGILVAVVGPRLGDQIRLAHETAAIQQIKGLHATEAQFYAQFGKYACSLVELGPPPAGTNMIPKSLADGHKSGYTIELHCTSDGYALTAVPESASSGRRSFYTDHNQVIRQNWSREPADVNSPEI